jgi:predicted amidohydrolase
MYKSLLVSVITVFSLFCFPGLARAIHPGVRVAMVQMDVVDGNLVENMKRAKKGIEKAVRMKVDLICLPEAADLGWLCQKARSMAYPIPGKFTDFLSTLAREHNVYISAGCLENDGNKTYNSAVLINRTGEILLRHRKINTLPKLTSHLYEAGSPDSIKIVDTEFGQIGITICADNFSTEYPRKIAALGAWLLITPYGFAEKKSDLPDNSVSFLNHVKKVAGESKLWVIGTDAANSEVAGGAWQGYLHSGCSIIADPEGKAKAIGKFNAIDVVIFDIPSEK